MDDVAFNKARLFQDQLKDWPGLIVAVSKYATIAQMASAYQAGFRDFGENKVTDALEKQASFTHPEVQWHLIGHLQSNKVNKAVGAFHLIHSIDSLALAEKISQRACYLSIRQAILLQVNIAEEPQKTGFHQAELYEQIKLISQLPGLNLRGLMTIAPDTQDTTLLQQVFGGLANLRKRCEDHLQQSLPELSMGMSNDFDHALPCGATIIRVGSRLFGTAVATRSASISDVVI